MSVGEETGGKRHATSPAFTVHLVIGADSPYADDCRSNHQYDIHRSEGDSPIYASL